MAEQTIFKSKAELEKDALLSEALAAHIKSQDYATEEKKFRIERCKIERLEHKATYNKTLLENERDKFWSKVMKVKKHE